MVILSCPPMTYHVRMATRHTPPVLETDIGKLQGMTRDEAIEWSRARYEQRSKHLPKFTIAERMRKARIDADIDRDAIAWFVGVEPNTVSRWENHWTPQPPPHHRLELWAIYTGVSLAWLLTGEGSASTIWYRAFAWSRRVLGLRSEGIRWAS